MKSVDCMLRRFLFSLLFLQVLATAAAAQDLDAIRDDQINRLKNYVVDAILPSGLVRDSLVLSGNSFHPATADAAGFALLALSALDHLDKLPVAEQRVETILSAYVGQRPGVVPERSADGHFMHFLNITTGGPAGGGWDASYSPISTALLVAGAEFARNHFSDNSTIASLTQQLNDSVDFDAAIRPGLTGGIFHNMTKAGGGAGGVATPFNEYMLVHSLALREEDNARALAVKHRWQDPSSMPKRSWDDIPTLTDSSAFASAFWVQQMHFFNGDFRHSAEFETYFRNHQLADQQYSSGLEGAEFRYGLTAGVSPGGYHADRILNHPENVFSPEAVVAWGDLETMLQFVAAQPPSSDTRYRYGLVRESGKQPNWIPSDTALVDHLFLLFGLVESLDPTFFSERMFPALSPGDFNADGVVDAADYGLWRTTFGSQTMLAADGNKNGFIDAADYVTWRNAIDMAGVAVVAVPEPISIGMLVVAAVVATLSWRSRKAMRCEVSSTGFRQELRWPPNDHSGSCSAYEREAARHSHEPNFSNLRRRCESACNARFAGLEFR
jgi:hypothetical protein